MRSFKSEGGATVTDEMLNAWGEAAEHGNYPGQANGAIVYSGEAPSDAELAARKSVEVTLSPDVLRLLDMRAAHSGITRDELVQRAVIHELAYA